MNKADNSSYWENFGYSIGGPVCYGFTKWFSDEISKRDDITDISFVARDGWLLKKAFEIINPDSKIKCHYIYASRMIAKKCEESKDQKEEYNQYLKSQKFGNGTIAVVDTATVNFSSIRLIDSCVSNKTYGFFWTAVSGTKESKDLSYSVYQKKSDNVLRCWELIEFILSSPEAPIDGLKNGEPVYSDSDKYEDERKNIFLSIEKGVLRYVKEISQAGEFPNLDCDRVVKKLNAFLAHPKKEDIEAFLGIRFSSKVDHTDSIPLDPFAKKKFSLQGVKRTVWLYATQRPLLYKVLHGGNTLRRQVLATIKGEKYEQYRDGRPEKLANKLSQYDLISFDVFDTLIKRPFEGPTDLFEVVEKETGIHNFKNFRIKAEIDARSHSSKPGQEVDIYDIYSVLEENYGISAREGIRREIEAEKRFCFANPEMFNVYRSLIKTGKHVVAVSDMYLPSDVIAEILNDCGYDAIDKIYVSCEQGVAKAEGILLHVVYEKEGKPKKCIHVGDNLASDVIGARKAGWDAVWYRV